MIFSKRIFKFFIILNIIVFLGLNVLFHSLLSAQEVSELPNEDSGMSLLVIPFKVNPTEEKINLWLGRAVSYYLTAGLQANKFDVLPDQFTTSLLEMNHILFPYSVTKAGIIQIAKKFQLSHAVWGEITLDRIDSATGEDTVINSPEKDVSLEKNATNKENGNQDENSIDSFNNSQYQVLLKGFVIDLKNYSQKYLPVIKGSLNDLYKIKDELLTAAVQTLDPKYTDGSIVFADFGLNLRNYELFIKSLLVKDNSKRIKILEKVKNAMAGKECDLLNFEMAALLYENGDWAAAGELLKKMSPEESLLPIFSYKKLFLTGLLAYMSEDYSTATESFNRLQNEGHYRFSANHNLGVIHFKQKDYKGAQSFFQQALSLRKDPITWLYFIYALLLDNEPLQAELELNQLLQMFPQEEKQIQLFSYFISKNQEKDLLFSVFQNYIPNLYLNEQIPGITLRLKNPFRMELTRPYSINEEESLEESSSIRPEEDTDVAIERLQGQLEMNPFMKKYYRWMTLLYMKNKDYRHAEPHAIALVFLENSKENNLLLAKIYKAMGNKKKAKEIKKRSKDLDSKTTALEN